MVGTVKSLFAAIFHRQPATIGKAAHAHRRKLLLEVLEDRLAPANAVWDGGGADNLASNAVNWAGDVLPVANDTLVFNNTSTKAATIDPAFIGSVAAMQVDAAYNSTITLTRNFTIVGGLTQSGSTITGTGNLWLQGSSTISAATMSGTGTTNVDADALLIVSANAILTLNQRALVVHADALMSVSGGLMLTNGAQVTVEPGGEFELRGNNTGIGAAGTPSSFVNQGLFVKVGSLATDLGGIAVPFSNNGTVRVDTGILVFASTYDQTLLDPVPVLEVGAAGEVRGVSMTIGAGTLQGAGILRVMGGGVLLWQGAPMNGTGQVVVDSGATMRIEGEFVNTGFAINNFSTIRWMAGDITLNNGAAINNKSQGLFLVECSAIMKNTAGTGTFNNYGTFRKIQAAVGDLTDVAVTFNSLTTPGQPASVVDVQAGRLLFQKSGTFAGQIQTALQTQVEFAGGPFTVFNLLNGTTFAGAGIIRITGSATMQLAANAVVTNGAIFEIGGNMIPPVLPDPTLSMGFLSGNGQFINFNTVNWRRGDIFDVTLFRNQGQMNILSENATSPVALNSSVLRNDGTITWTGFDLRMTSGFNPNRASEIQNFGTFNVQNGATLDYLPGGAGAIFRNEAGGVFSKIVGGATTIQVPFWSWGTVNLTGLAVDFSGGVYHKAGQVSVSNGTLTASFYSFTAGLLNLGNNGTGRLTLPAAAVLTIPQGAMLVGIGTITGNVVNNGLIDLGQSGASLGQLAITGDYTQSSTGTLKLRIKTPVLQSYDRLSITGSANLGGTLWVVPNLGFVAAAGDQYVVLTYAQRVGNFGTFNLPALPPPRAWAPVVPGNNNLTLVVQ